MKTTEEKIYEALGVKYFKNSPSDIMSKELRNNRIVNYKKDSLIKPQ